MHPFFSQSCVETLVADRKRQFEREAHDHHLARNLRSGGGHVGVISRCAAFGRRHYRRGVAAMESIDVISPATPSQLCLITTRLRRHGEQVIADITSGSPGPTTPTSTA